MVPNGTPYGVEGATIYIDFLDTWGPLEERERGRTDALSHRMRSGGEPDRSNNGLVWPFGEAELLAVELHCTPVVKNREIVFADGHTASNTPDLFWPPKLSGAGPG